MNAALKKGEFKLFVVENILFITEDFPLTETQKLQRGKIIKEHKDELDALFKSGEKCSELRQKKWSFSNPFK